MKTSKLLIIAIAATVSLFTACTAEEEDYPANRELVFQVGLKGTRATPDNSWAVGDFIAVKVGGVVKKYVITDLSGKAVGADADNTFYWDELGASSVKVSAWSFGGKYVSSLEDSITTVIDQRTYDNYKVNDFVYAKETAIKQGQTGTLTFYHQMARLNFNIKVDDANETVTDMFIGGEDDYSRPLLKARFFYTDTLSNYGWFEFSDESMVTTRVIPYKEETAATGFDVSYSAIVIPITIEGAFFEIKTTDGKVVTSYPIESWNLSANNPDIGLYYDPGYEYTINITIKNKQLIIGNGKTAVTVNDWIE